MNRVWISLLIVTACQAHAEPPKQETRVDPATAAPPPHVVKPAPVEAKAPSPSSAALPTGEQLQLVERFVAKDVLALTPDQAAARFADRFALKRENEIEEGFLLAGGNAKERVQFDYSPDAKGKFYSGVAGLLFYASSAQVPQLKASLLDAVTKKLGKPKKAGAGDDSPTWKLARRVEVMLLDYPNTEHPGEQVVELRVAEPGGP